MSEFKTSPFGVQVSDLRVPEGRARRHNCGRRGLLTVPEISRVSGVSREAIYRRIRCGVTGAALCAKKHHGERTTKAKCTRPTVLLAMKLARAFPDDVPTVMQIRKVHPMTDRNAMRWRQAMAEAEAEQ